ncbi:MAG TPA: 3-deoxy-D-manno-octulosonic acid transferase [Phenylobacterium sp.]|nr:3-deoxy-D-manno-octulosonic acid transferase [Phenylobacterium sp.]
MSLALAAYRLAAGLAEPLAGPLLRRRSRRGKEDGARLGERLGRASQPRPPGPLVWLHGVSVGESVSLLPLVEALRAARPDLAMLVTSGTRTSADLLARRLPAGVLHQYAPVDGPRAVAAFLDHWRPDLALLVESELWPNLILAAQARGTRLALASARITEKSARGWGRAPGAAAGLLSAFDLILPQDEATAGRLAALGARPGPQLNLKTVGAPLPCDPAELAALKDAWGGRPVILAASTHPGEEAMVLEAFKPLAERDPAPLLVLAPRHPERGAEVGETARAAGLSVGRRALGQAPGAVYVAETLGELGLFFRLAEAVVLGGGFAPGVGGHNPLEPARLGRCVITGPEVFNAQSLYDQLFEACAVLFARDGADLARHMAGLLDNPVIARRMGEAAQAVARRGDAALERALEHIWPLLPEVAP